MRFLLLAVFFVLFLLCSADMCFKKSAPARWSLARAWPIFLPLVAAAIAVSYLISVRIFLKKEI